MCVQKSKSGCIIILIPDVVNPDALIGQDPYVVGSLFLEFFMKLPEKLFTVENSEKFLWAQGNSNFSD